MFELREFFIEGGSPKKSHVLLHITEPSDAAEEASKGYFFALAEIEDGTENQIQLLQQMIDEIETGYYENDDGREKDAFELTLEYINRRGSLLLENKKAELHCIVGIFKGNLLSFSYHGRPAAKIIFNKNDKYQLLNILDKEDENQSSGQLFSAIMQGQLREGDFFYLCTPQADKHISKQQLLNTLPARTARQSAEYIQKILSSLRDGYSYGGIIIYLKPKLIKHDSFKKPLNPLAQKRENNSSAVVQSKKEKKVHADIAPETNYRERDEFESESMTNLLLINFGRMLLAVFKTLFNLARKIFILIGKIFIGTFILVLNRGGGRAMVIQSFHDYIDRQKKFIRGLPRVSKILFLLTLSLSVVFVGSLGYLNLKRSRAQKAQTYLNETQTIEDKRAAAEASMIYEDDAKAFVLLKEAQAMLSRLPNKTKVERERSTELSVAINSDLKILQKINAANSELIADLKQIQTSASTNKLARVNDDLIAYGPEDLFLYKLNINTGELKKINHQTIPDLRQASTPKEQDKIIFLTGDNAVAQYSPESDTVVARKISLNEGTTLSNLFVYSQKLYTIDAAGNQILKHNPTQIGYDKGTPWLKDEVDLVDAVSLAIDGDLFLLKANGEIYKIVSGVKQEFIVSGLDPALDNPTELWTYNNVKNIYILEPTNKRVVILDKQGRLLEQYTQESWQNPTGMVVDEEKKVIYILDDNKIYRFGIE